MAYADRGRTEGPTFVTLATSSGIMDLSVWYPEQQPDAVVAYPFSVGLAGNGKYAMYNVTVKNVTLVNSYQGIRFGPDPPIANSLHYLQNVFITALSCGIDIDGVSDIGRLENVHLGPKYWSWSRLPGTAAEGGPHIRWMRENATGLILRRDDWCYLSYVYVDGCKTGILLHRDAGQDQRARSCTERAVLPGARGSLPRRNRLHLRPRLWSSLHRF